MEHGLLSNLLLVCLLDLRIVATGLIPTGKGMQVEASLITEILKAATARGAVERLQTFLSETSVNHFMMLIGDTDTLYYVDYDSGQLTIDALSLGIMY